MKAKRLIFMLMVALMSVTGAWAETVTITYERYQLEAPYEIAVDKITRWLDNASPVRTSYPIETMINNNIYTECKYTLQTNSIGRTTYLGEAWYIAKSITIKSLDEHVRIHSVIVEGTSFSASYDQGVEELTMNVLDGSKLSTINNIIVEYEWYHEYGETGAAQYTCQYQYEDGHVCGYVDEAKAKELHQHTTTSNWSYDDNQHWKICEETFGICPANNRKLEIGDHEYGTENIEAFCTCKVCGYYSEKRYAEINRDYLSFIAVGAPMTIGMTKTGSPDNYDLLYSFDKVNWTPVALTATNSNVVDIPSGQTCYFRHGTTTAINGISTKDNYWTFTMTGSGTIEADGNIMSLLDINVKKKNLGSFAFANLFKGCDKLTKAPKLPATSLSERCYMGMFEGTGITEAPALPAASVIKGSYQNMFRNCLNLEKAPELVATTVKYLGYNNMFYGCKKIKELTIGNIIDIENPNAFGDWLYGTAYETEGTLIAPDALVGKSEIKGSLPSNWMFKQIRDYISAVNNALEGAPDFIKAIGADFIEQIKSATSNDAALNLRDEALSGINLLKKYGSQIEEGMFHQPAEPGMRLKVTKKDGKVYEFSTKDIESTEYYRATE